MDLSSHNPLSSAQLMHLATKAAAHSPNRSRKTGAALYSTTSFELLTGCNTFPPGVSDLDERHEGEARYLWIEHAERNVIAHAAKRGVSTAGTVMATPWFPCVECARAIVGAGIARLVCTEPDWTEARYNFRIAETILREGGVTIEFFNEDA